MESIKAETLQRKFGLNFGEARKLANKIEKLQRTNPKAQIKAGYIEENDSLSLVLILNFDRYKKESINNKSE